MFRLELRTLYINKYSRYYLNNTYISTYKNMHLSPSGIQTNQNSRFKVNKSSKKRCQISLSFRENRQRQTDG